MLQRWVGFSILLCLAAAAAGDIKATTEDGRQVILRDNGTWDFAAEIDEDRGERRAVLTLEDKSELARGCRLGLRLDNQLTAQIRTLVLRFTAYKGDDIAFETVSRGFSYLKPTTSQYQEIAFRGIQCGEISSVEVSAARNCHVGDLTKYSAGADHCLDLIEVAPSQILPIAKRVTGL